MVKNKIWVGEFYYRKRSGNWRNPRTGEVKVNPVRSDWRRSSVGMIRGSGLSHYENVKRHVYGGDSPIPRSKRKTITFVKPK